MIVFLNVKIKIVSIYSLLSVTILQLSALYTF